MNEWEAINKVISRINIRRRITIPLTLSNLKPLRRITRTENILHRNFTRRQVAIQNRVARNNGISQSTFSVKVLNLFSLSRRKTNKHKRKHSAMLRNRDNSKIGISQSTYSVKVLNLFSRSRLKTNKRKSKHSAMLRNKETRHRMFIGLLNTTRKLA